MSNLDLIFPIFSKFKLSNDFLMYLVQVYPVAGVSFS